jgi:hypothetical protein
MSKKNPRTGSTFDSFLTEEGILAEVDEAARRNSKAAKRAIESAAAVSRGVTFLLDADAPVSTAQQVARAYARAIKIILAATAPNCFIKLPWERLQPLGFTSLNIGRILSRMVAEGKLKYGTKGWRRPKVGPDE